MRGDVARLVLFGGLLAALIYGGVKVVSSVRGIRNHNPGNIRRTDTEWLGQSATQTDPEYVQFTAPEYGIRAMAKIFKSYASRGVVTLQGIISTWAPPNENDTAGYIRRVVARTGLAPTAVMSPMQYPALIAGMLPEEIGTQPYSTQVIADGVSMS